LLISTDQLHTHLFGKFDECDLIRRRGLEVLLFWVVRIWVDWRNVVAETKSEDKVSDDVMLLSAVASNLLCGDFLRCSAVFF